MGRERRGSVGAVGRGGRGSGGAHNRGGRGGRGLAGGADGGYVQHSSNQAAGTGAGEAYTGPGSGFWILLFGPNSESSYVQAEEEPVIQNAPEEDR